MASNCLPRQTLHHPVANLLFLFLFLMASLPVNMNSVSFNFPDFNTKTGLIDTQGDASIYKGQLQLTTRDPASGRLSGTAGRALYKIAVPLWDASTKRVADFATNFTFNISTPDINNAGDGLTFILVPVNTSLPNDSSGSCLALFSQNPNTGCVLNQTVLAVEFDTYPNPFDLTPFNHIGIDNNSIVSAAYVNVSDGLKNTVAHAFISYSSTTKNLSVSLSMNGTSDPFNISYNIDLMSILPEKVQVGFSASTGASLELHNILAWSFDSTLEETIPPSPAQSTQGTQPTNEGKGGKGGLVAGLAVGISLILIFGAAIVWIRLRRRNSPSPRERNIEAARFDIDEDFDNEAGPKRFAYSELSEATNNFASEGKLGEGGFGGVYKGLLTGSREIAVKKIKSGSTQGKKEYIAEVKIISKLRHRNLVQLLGWYHDSEELLLVYEFMPNGSLDSHLFGRRLPLLPWPIRYKIALGLGSALIYLHEEWEQSVVHRDIKSSNVMLDLNFNPKLGDFGLARLVDHDAGSQTTVPAGTPGYLAPECLLTGKASKESDVYSFGIVALEIACGRKVIEVTEKASKVNLVQWVWDLYGKGLVLDAIDNGLEGDFDEQQAKCLMVVGLWCSHPDVSYRPSIKQAIAALNLETALPNLPPQLPVPIYVSPSMNMSLLYSYASSSMTEGNYGHTSNSSISTATTNSSLQSEKSNSGTHPLLGAK